VYGTRLIKLHCVARCYACKKCVSSRFLRGGWCLTLLKRLCDIHCKRAVWRSLANETSKLVKLGNASLTHILAPMYVRYVELSPRDSSHPPKPLVSILLRTWPSNGSILGVLLVRTCTKEYSLIAAAGDVTTGGKGSLQHLLAFSLQRFPDRKHADCFVSTWCERDKRRSARGAASTAPWSIGSCPDPTSQRTYSEAANRPSRHPGVSHNHTFIHKTSQRRWPRREEEIE